MCEAKHRYKSYVSEKGRGLKKKKKGKELELEQIRLGFYDSVLLFPSLTSWQMSISRRVNQAALSKPRQGFSKWANPDLLFHFHLVLFYMDAENTVVSRIRTRIIGGLTAVPPPQTFIFYL